LLLERTAGDGRLSPVEGSAILHGQPIGDPRILSGGNRFSCVQPRTSQFEDAPARSISSK
jgi:hypothetical protein